MPNNPSCYPTHHTTSLLLTILLCDLSRENRDKSVHTILLQGVNHVPLSSEQQRGREAGRNENFA